MDKNQTGDKRPQISFGPGGPGGGHRNNMSRVNGEKPKRTKETLGRLLKYIGRSRYILIALLIITLLVIEKLTKKKA